MPSPLSRRKLLATTATATTATLAGCSVFATGNNTEPLEPGDTAPLDSDITAYAIWTQQSFLYWDGTHQAIAGLPNRSVIFAHVTGTTKLDTLSLQTSNNSYTPQRRPLGINAQQIAYPSLTGNLPVSAPEENSVLVGFTVSTPLDVESVELVYTGENGTARWEAGDDLRAALAFPPSLTINEQDTPAATPGETVTLSTTLENTGGSTAYLFARAGVRPTMGTFPLTRREIPAGTNTTIETTTEIPDDIETATYVFDWGLGYKENPLTFSDSESSDDGTTL